MEVVYAIIAIVFLIIGLIVALKYDVNPIPTLFILASLLIVLTSLHNTSPSAIDVYQGKTTLEYTYRDGVAVDSIVVFKEE